ncbi:MAG: hydantoinase/oxoprolinase family protein [Spirochaetes bacterium]|nr:MAG: hydantoinase/oxoprolinase family protein [Spirochaetota bacterium]
MLIGLDVGGTHTDSVLIGKEGILAQAKVPTNHEDLLESVIAGIRAVIGGTDAAAVTRVNLSTTLSTNAIVEGKAEKVGVVVTAGAGIDPRGFSTGDHFAFVPGSIDHRGTQTAMLDEKSLDAAAKAFRKAGLRVYAAVGKFSTRNITHENAIRDALAAQSDFTTAGHLLSGRLNFPRRIATAYYNSAVWRRYTQFADAVEEGVRALGIRAALCVLKADGGTMPLALSRSLPVETILSGPAASVMGIVALCRPAEDSVLLDIGGTTTDIAVFAAGDPLIEPDGISLDGRPTLVRALRTRSIGVGGDSALEVRDGAVLVGPVRRGFSMADGGAHPTLTDACNVGGFSSYGGTDRSAKGIGELAKRHGMKPAELANAAVETAVASIRGQVEALVSQVNERPVYTIHEMIEGKRIEPRTVYVVGGPARTFAPLIEKAMGVKTVLPNHHGVANAVGAGLARTTMYIELLADTEQRRLIIPDLNVAREITPGYALADAEKDAKRYLLDHMRAQQVTDVDISAEVVESSVFHMVRGFTATGKNIRVRCQVKPGVLEEFAGAVAGQ